MLVYSQIKYSFPFPFICRLIPVKGIITAGISSLTDREYFVLAFVGEPEFPVFGVPDIAIRCVGELSPKSLIKRE